MKSGGTLAAADAKLTGKLGVCLSTLPGAVHLLNGLYAKADGAPVLCNCRAGCFGRGRQRRIPRNQIERMFDHVRCL
ncbi:thiamine pyrophosphate-binding protein [Bacillus sp. SL00103]